MQLQAINPPQHVVPIVPARFPSRFRLLEVVIACPLRQSSRVLRQ